MRAIIGLTIAAMIVAGCGKTEGEAQAAVEQKGQMATTPATVFEREEDFARFPVAVSRARVIPPIINDDTRDFRTFYRENWGTAPNFAGHYTVMVMGCGTSCVMASVGDQSTGQIHGIGMGGEEYKGMTLGFRPNSELLKVGWQDGDECIVEFIRWTNNQPVRVPGGGRFQTISDGYSGYCEFENYASDADDAAERATEALRLADDAANDALAAAEEAALAANEAEHVQFADDEPNGPSFDCRRARTATEGAICGNATLSRLDWFVGELWDRVNGYRTESLLRMSQPDWLRFRDTCGADVDCLRGAYEQRIEVLEPLAVD